MLSLVACSRSAADRALARAESLMDEHPDSALVVLQSILPEKLHSRQSNALYALLLTQARDKTYRFDTSDSLISIAVDYYVDNGDWERAAWSHFYRGAVYFNKKDYRSAISEILTARELSYGGGNPYLTAKIHEQIADIYAASFDMSKAISNRHVAAANFRLAGKKLNELYAFVDMAREYGRDGRVERSIALLDSIMQNADTLSNPDLSGYIQDSYIWPLMKSGRTEEALQRFRKSRAVWPDGEDEIQDLPGIAIMYSRLGMPDSAEYFMVREPSPGPTLRHLRPPMAWRPA
ncbi:hypothetical protein [uncultured Muribaculum sp.]|uniref:hypothetical protein n=1 Tax=uncultured Muribaculum sp. TaxID=1918613 RepID=UPI0026023A3D|nr:hypothetical protein [uncultured Muribaculum sp.]